MSTTAKVLIAGGVVAGLIVVSSVASLAASLRPSNLTSAEQPIAVESAPPSAAPSTAPTPDQTEVPVVVDVAAFKTSTTRDLADFEKDLNDMVVTVDEGGFWRLLSNSLELSFNLGQLQAAEAPASAEPEWTQGLVKLEASITAIDDAVGDDDEKKIRAAIEASRAQVVALRAIVKSAD